MGDSMEKLKRTFNLEPETWNKLQRVCRAEKRTQSGMLDFLIQNYPLPEVNSDTTAGQA